jgi:hypothetical protein
MNRIANRKETSVLGGDTATGYILEQTTKQQTRKEKDPKKWAVQYKMIMTSQIHAWR